MFWAKATKNNVKEKVMRICPRTHVRAMCEKNKKVNHKWALNPESHQDPSNEKWTPKQYNTKPLPMHREENHDPWRSANHRNQWKTPFPPSLSRFSYFEALSINLYKSHQILWKTVLLQILHIERSGKYILRRRKVKTIDLGFVNGELGSCTSDGESNQEKNSLCVGHHTSSTTGRSVRLFSFFFNFFFPILNPN